MQKPLTLLLIEDNVADARYIEILLREVTSQKYIVRNRHTFHEGMELLGIEKADLLLLDLSLPDSFGLETVQNANITAPDLPIIVLTGRSDEDFAVEVVNAGAQDYLVKGEINGPLLSRAIRYAIKRKEMETDLKNINKRLEESEQSLNLNNANLLRANKALDRFVYIISHELKKPVANIIGLLNILASEMEALSDKSKLVYEKLNFSAVQLKKMIGDILEETKKGISNDNNFETIDLSIIINEVMTGLDQFIMESKTKISLDLERSPVISFSYQDLKTIISNLLTNAIKYRSPNRENQITIRADVEQGKRTLSFTDNGIGMDLEKNGESLFKKYQRFNADAEGTGLGLWIVKEIMDKNGSTIDVKSQIDKGTVFKIVF